MAIFVKLALSLALASLAFFAEGGGLMLLGARQYMSSVSGVPAIRSHGSAWYELPTRTRADSDGSASGWSRVSLDFAVVPGATFTGLVLAGVYGGSDNSDHRVFLADLYGSSICCDFKAARLPAFYSTVSDGKLHNIFWPTSAAGSGTVQLGVLIDGVKQTSWTYYTTRTTSSGNGPSLSPLCIFYDGTPGFSPQDAYVARVRVFRGRIDLDGVPSSGFTEVADWTPRVQGGEPCFVDRVSGAVSRPKAAGAELVYLDGQLYGGFDA